MLKKISIISFIFLILLSGCAPKEAPKDESQTQINPDETELVDPTEEKEESPFATNTDVKITYDLSNLPSAEKVGRRVETSFFSQRLLGNEVSIYNKIIAAAADWQTEVSLSNCDEKTLARIMNIVLLDSTSTYNLDYEYSYEMMEGSDRYVSKVYLYYITTKEEYNNVVDHINNVVRPYEELIMSDKTVIDALKKAVAEVNTILNTSTRKPSSFSNVEMREFNVFTSLARAYFDDSQVKHELGVEFSGINSLETAKLLNLFLHHSGVNSLVGIADYKGSKNTDFVYVTQEDGRKHVTLNIEDFIFFNEVKINDEWYVISLKEEYQRPREGVLGTVNIDIEKNDNFYVLITDRTYASSHVFWQTDENLGILPPCNSLDFVYAYRTGDFVPEPNLENPTNEQLKEYVSLFVERLVEDVTPKSMAQSPTIVVKFENMELYNMYNEFFSENVKNFASLSGRKIEDYEVEYHPEALMIILHDFYSY